MVDVAVIMFGVLDDVGIGFDVAVSIGIFVAAGVFIRNAMVAVDAVAIPTVCPSALD